MFIAAFSTKDRSPVRAVCLYLQLLKRYQKPKLTYGAVFQPHHPIRILSTIRPKSIIPTINAYISELKPLNS